jgi:hypothetical protein
VWEIWEVPTFVGMTDQEGGGGYVREEEEEKEGKRRLNEG